jgi:hypothetical protein
MSSDGVLKFAHISHVSGAGEAPATPRKHGQQSECICAFCENHISRRQHPVLLKSGKSVHLHCYLQMPKRHGNRGRNSK